MPTPIKDNILLCLILSEVVVVDVTPSLSIHDACCDVVVVDVVVDVVVVDVVGPCWSVDVGPCCWSMIAKRSSMSLATIRPVIAPRRMQILIIIVEMFDQH